MSKTPSKKVEEGKTVVHEHLRKTENRVVRAVVYVQYPELFFEAFESYSLLRARMRNEAAGIEITNSKGKMLLAKSVVEIIQPKD